MKKSLSLLRSFEFNLFEFGTYLSFVLCNLEFYPKFYFYG